MIFHTTVMPAAWGFSSEQNRTLLQGAQKTTKLEVLAYYVSTLRLLKIEMRKVN